MKLFHHSPDALLYVSNNPFTILRVDDGYVLNKIEQAILAVQDLEPNLIQNSMLDLAIKAKETYSAHEKPYTKLYFSTLLFNPSLDTLLHNASLNEENKKYLTEAPLFSKQGLKEFFSYIGANEIKVEADHEHQLLSQTFNTQPTPGKHKPL